MALFSNVKKNLSQGIDFIAKGEYTQAVSLLTSLLNQNPRNKEIYFALGQAYWHTKQTVLLKENLLALVKLNLTTEEIYSVLEITNHKLLVSYSYFNTAPAFSPNGQYLVYISARNDTNHDGKIDVNDRGGVYLYDLLNHTETLLVSDDYYNSVPSFSPDGTKILCLSTRRDTDHDGYIGPRDNAELCIFNLATRKEQLFISGEWRFKHPSFSPDGTKILFCGWRPGALHSGIYLWDLNSGETIRCGRENYDHTFPSFSPDGKKIVYTSWRRDTNGDNRIDIRDNTGIYLWDIETNTETEIITCQYDNRFPSFSPDNENIIFISRRRDTNGDGTINSFDNPGIYLYNIKTRKEQLIVNDENFNSYPLITPDGKQIIYLGSSRDKEKKNESESADYFERKGIYCCNIDGRNERILVSERYYGCRTPAISPVKNQVAYISWRQNTNRGLYFASLNDIPDLDTLTQYINQNL